MRGMSKATVPSSQDALNAFVGGGGVAMFFPLGQPTTWRVIAMSRPRIAGSTPKSNGGAHQ